MWLEVVLYAFVAMIVIVTIGCVFVPTIMDIIKQFRNTRKIPQDSEALQEEVEKMLRSPPDSSRIDEEIRKIQEELEHGTGMDKLADQGMGLSSVNTTTALKEKGKEKQ